MLGLKRLGQPLHLLYMAYSAPTRWRDFNVPGA